LNNISKLTHYSSNAPPTAHEIPNSRKKQTKNAIEMLANSLEHSKKGDNDSLTAFKPAENSPSFGSERNHLDGYIPKS